MGVIRATMMLCVMLNLTGCFSSVNNKPKENIVDPIPQQFYVIDVDRGLREHDRSDGRVLYLAPVVVTSQFRAKEIVFKVEDNAFQPQPEHQFFDTPQAMLTTQLQGWLTKTGFFKRVELDNSQQADYVLEVAVTGLYGDKREGYPAKSVLEMQFFMTDRHAKAEEVVFQTGLHIDIDIAETTPSNTVNGWETGMIKLLSTLEDDLSSYFSNHTP
ncbi:MAG: cholesterol transport system auxiliary component [Methylophagaceae bacterium]